MSTTSGAPTSTLTWIDAVLRIMVRPAGQARVEVLLHGGVSRLVQHAVDLAPRVEPGADEVDAGRVERPAHRCGVGAHRGHGGGQARGGWAAQLELTAGLEGEAAAAGEVREPRRELVRRGVIPRFRTTGIHSSSMPTRPRRVGWRPKTCSSTNRRTSATVRVGVGEGIVSGARSGRRPR